MKFAHDRDPTLLQTPLITIRFIPLSSSLPNGTASNHYHLGEFGRLDLVGRPNLDMAGVLSGAFKAIPGF
jgi:hypothetical protein